MRFNLESSGQENTTPDSPSFDEGEVIEQGPTSEYYSLIERLADAAPEEKPKIQELIDKVLAQMGTNNR
jgi:hypothetical protein